MKQRFSIYPAIVFLCLAPAALMAAGAASGVLSAPELKKIIPDVYFFRGQSAPVQLRNSAGFKISDKFVLAGLVDTSGYASDIQVKYQGFFITEVKLNVEGTDVGPGQYGFGFSKDGKFSVMDVGANDLFSVSAHTDGDLKRPVPLKMEAVDGNYRLYAGRQWVNIKAQ
jgi:hypothetical protein